MWPLTGGIGSDLYIATHHHHMSIRRGKADASKPFEAYSVCSGVDMGNVTKYNIFPVNMIDRHVYYLGANCRKAIRAMLSFKLVITQLPRSPLTANGIVNGRPSEMNIVPLEMSATGWFINSQR